MISTLISLSPSIIAVRSQRAPASGRGTAPGPVPDHPFRRRCSAACGRPLRGAVEADHLVGGGGVLGALVVAPPPGEPGEPHREPAVLLDLPPGGGVGRGEGQL